VPEASEEGSKVQRGSRIVFGANAIDNQFPHYAFMYVSRPTATVQCGGGLISTNFVLTAKHCINE
jgi:secreted trypsin-like serine protease